MVVARLTFAKLKPDVSLEREEVGRLWDENLVPAAMAQKGFIACFLLVSEHMNEGIAVGIWESRAHAGTSERSGYYQEQLARFEKFYLAPPERKFYEVNSKLVFVNDL